MFSEWTKRVFQSKSCTASSALEQDHKVHGQRKCFKDNLKANLKACKIRPDVWEDIARTGRGGEERFMMVLRSLSLPGAKETRSAKSAKIMKGHLLRRPRLLSAWPTKDLVPPKLSYLATRVCTNKLLWTILLDLEGFLMMMMICSLQLGSFPSP